ncbi:hypothetical protein NIES970_23770 [[Synechococcus] sp. NIES-970]|uniref:hypothetical protein n=1 Tax=Picosynechococcus sp. NKBG15041c TaxID=1407650 RepID=UPI0003F9C240|nr:hypothetical protein [Picosynechococcus sp. NKBG15041c]BAW97425.1 hypothetical protein NIES970_23770 [[Synechococcus] sp. NIES-970]
MEKDAKSPLILILPCALLMTVFISVWTVCVVVIAFCVAWFLWQQYRWQQLNHTLTPSFRRLIEANQGKITVADLTTATGLAGQDVRWFLNHQVKKYGAQTLNYEQGVVYYFLTSGALGSMFNGSDPEQKPVTAQTQTTAQMPSVEPPPPMIQTELAKRFSVHPSTLNKRRKKANFAEWSKVKDPDNIPWRYDPKTKQFSPQM